ncbi:unnamed protein product [Rotaria sp. Silwood2]|nr:unnamed protein product [Rotaria sp. Silwood2]CAF2779791.1 unnamed protein product [Rotaria sp. Silwood2]CAF3146271.1 unnamed protein product [Rotaria sp. Silwood2]CAF3235146.1 unnamed protein product [Rotaria sp. Silwood2]CAF4066905.1 unnamed protein product [Rotaria sp. Silwood2]
MQYQGSSSNMAAIAEFGFNNNYNMIQIGWICQPVRAVVGSQKRNVVSESSVRWYTSMVVQYTGIKEEGQKGDSVVTLEFSNEKLLAKSQYGWSLYSNRGSS